MLSVLNSESRGDSKSEKPDKRKKDLRVELKVKNNSLWHAIFDNYPSVLAFCRAHDELKGKYSDIYNLLSFKLYPFKKARASGRKDRKDFYYTSDYIKICLLLERVLRVPAEDLFPKHLYDFLVSGATSKAIEISSFTALPFAVKREILALPAPAEEGPDAKVEKILLRERISKVLKTLSWREREVIKLRYGFPDGYCYTLEEIGEILELSRGRIGQIEAKAIYKLQQPARSQQLKNF